MLDEFKKFILKGNVVDLSTGVIIGAAFGGIVTAFTKGVIEPILALFGGGSDVGLKIEMTKKLAKVPKLAADGKAIVENGVAIMDDKWVPINLDLGLIIGSVISFLITAAVVFFVIVKPANKLMTLMKRKEAEAPPAAPAPTPTETLLTEIRDALRK